MHAGRRSELLILLALAVLVTGLGLLFIDLHFDRSFIIYRYARTLADGGGLAYNPGQPVLSAAAAPLYVLLLALGSGALSDLPLLGNLISIVAAGLGTAGLFWLALPAPGEGDRTLADRLAAGGAAAVYATFPLLWLAIGLDTALWMALCLLAVALHRRGWGAGAAALLALATLTRPETAVLICVLVADSLSSGRRFQPLTLGIYGAILLPGILWLTSAVSSGGPLPGLPGVGPALTPPDVLAPDVITGLGRLSAALFELSPLWAAALIPALFGLLALRQKRGVLILLGWGGLHIAALGILGAGVYPWHFVPLVPALALLAALGVQWVAGRLPSPGLQPVAAAIGVLLVGGAAADSLLRLAPLLDSVGETLAPEPVEAAYVQAGLWLRENTPPQVWIGATQIGVLGYVSERRLIDYQGSLQPDVAEAAGRGDGGWWIGAYTPAYLVLRAGELENLDGYAPAADPWFRSTYAEVARFEALSPPGEPVVILARITDPPPLVEQVVGMVGYPRGLVLNGIAADFSLGPLEGGRMGRLRLEWLLNNPIELPLVVALAIRGHEGAVAAYNEQIVDFAGWPTRRLITTFHWLELLPDPAPGVYDLLVGIGPDAASLTWHPVAQAKVPFPDSVYVGALSGVRAEFGRITLLGYRLARTPDAGLEVLLHWQAAQPPLVDYRVLIQLRNMQGAVVTQSETEPYGGAYPTSIWSMGEEVTDSYRLDIAALPPGEYEVYVGLIDPDGGRLLALDGRDAVLVGRTNLGP